MKHSNSSHRQLPPADAPAGVPGATTLRVVHDSTATVPDWLKRRVLLLNATYEPLTALPARRAVVLMAGGKADTVHDDPLAPLVRSAEWSVQLPSVIRLRNYVRVPYHARVPLTRAALMHRDRNRCAYCGGKAETIDHVVPRSRGGRHTWDNVVAACRPCNVRKRDRLLEETSMRLLRQPTEPTGLSWLTLAVGSVPETWTPYLQLAA